MDDLRTIEYDRGINDDLYAPWRNDHHIGYVQMAFKIITEAMYDLILGDYNCMMSAHYFFFGGVKDSQYKLWARVIGNTEGTLPDIVIKFRENGHVTQREANYIRGLCTTVKTI